MLCRNIFISQQTSPVANHQNPPKIDLRNDSGFSHFCKNRQKKVFLYEKFLVPPPCTERGWWWSTVECPKRSKKKIRIFHFCHISCCSAVLQLNSSRSVSGHCKMLWLFHGSFQVWRHKNALSAFRGKVSRVPTLMAALAVSIIFYGIVRIFLNNFSSLK